MTQQEQAKVWQAEDLPGIELLQATFIKHSFPKHFHESYGIGLSDRGSGIIHCQGATYTTSPSQLIFFHPGEVHSGHANAQSGWTYRMIYLDIATVVASLEGNPLTLSFPQTTFGDAAIAAVFNTAHREFSRSASTLEREAALQNFIKVLYQQTTHRDWLKPSISASRAVRQVRDYLEEHSQDNISINTLAELADLSPAYLVTAFREVVGIPPHQYQIQVRVQRAKAMLQAQKSLAQIAIELGFCDQSHFTRCFKRIVGVSPGKYLALAI